jgi:protein-S-isoprenylcysteine O-methyltransferase Ste14
MWKLLIFAAASLGLIYVSRQALTRPRSHGFYRFFAWEFILASFLLNISDWFKDWLAWYQVLSWALLIVSILPPILGIRALRERGQPNRNQRSEPALLAFERTTKLVSDGVYRYIRHPLYSSLLLLGWGIFFKQPSWIGLALTLVASLFLVATARADEAECIDCFGAEYREYMQHTRMFIPFVF